jgi:hypothetical protein
MNSRHQYLDSIWKEFRELYVKNGMNSRRKYLIVSMWKEFREVYVQLEGLHRFLRI